jgi:hypothetical protein
LGVVRSPISARCAPSMSETWALLVPATFGLLGALAGGYLTYRSALAAERRTERRDARAALVALLDSVLEVDPDATRHRKSARQAVSLLMAQGLPSDVAVDLLDAASHWARLLPDLQRVHWTSTGESSPPSPMGDAVKMGPDVRRLYAAAVTALLSWLDAAPLRRRWSAERLGESCTTWMRCSPGATWMLEAGSVAVAGVHWCA